MTRSIAGKLNEISVVLAAEFLALADTYVGTLIQEFPTPESIHRAYSWVMEQCETSEQLHDLQLAKSRWQEELMNGPTQMVLSMLEEEGFTVIGS